MPQFVFSLVSPEREVFTGNVDAVVIPGTEGIFEVRAGHAPVMATLSPGMVEVHQGGQVKKTYVRGGFADVAPTGLTVLAERAVAENDLSSDRLEAERAEAKNILGADSSSPEDKINAQRVLETLSRL